MKTMNSNPCLHLHTRLLLGSVMFWILCFASPTYGFDALDPNGNITIKWDLMKDNGGTQDVRVSIFNFQLFRHVDNPGWKLTWTWPGDEVIWSMSGAEASEQGNCSAFKGGNSPHCCEKEPVILDLLPGAPYNKQVANCCKGGVLSSMTQDPSKYMGSFQMSIGSSGTGDDGGKVIMLKFPGNFSIGVPGYTCGEAHQVPPTKFIEDNGRRRTQALGTWNVTCSYSQFRASPSPSCCVSLSAFYNETIVPCPKCSCACQGQMGAKCMNDGDLPPVLQLQPREELKPVVHCSPHMCPVKIHWHVKLNYREYWRVKLTITNLNFVKSYSDWNVVVMHPNLSNLTQVFSFNYKSLNPYGNINDTGLFYGVQYYNDMLLQSGVSGNVQTELLLRKDPGEFTFSDGWAFPRRISFNGEECVMPQPDDYPRVPKSHSSATALQFSLGTLCGILLSFIVLLMLF